MALVTLTAGIAGQIFTAALYNNNNNALANQINGNIDATNLAANAVTTVKILDANVTDAKLAGITTAGKVNGTAITNLAGIPAGAGTLPSANMSIGGTVGFANFQTGTYATGTTLLPVDDTVPLNTEGDQYMSLVYTPTSATSTLQIRVVVCGASGADGASTAAALFKDTDANALKATAQRSNFGTNPGAVVLNFTHTMTSGTTSAITFKVRAGQNLAGTFHFNGQSDGAAQMFGGVNASSITVTEIK